MKRVATDRREDGRHGIRSDELPAPGQVRDENQLGQFIPLHYHGQMLADERRMAAFREAIEKLVPMGAHVVDLGGGTGVQSFFAAARARKVTYVEGLELVADTARRLLANNGVGDRVSVVRADARAYVPDEPVDAVVCEMLHAGLLREKQVEVLTAFKAHHEERFGKPIPLIIPEATVLAVQPVFHPYEFDGYRAPVPLFEAGSAGAMATPMGQPEVYALIEYVQPLPSEISAAGFVCADQKGTINALRIITKNVVGVFPEEGRSTDWHMHFLCIPLPQSFQVEPGDRIALRFRYAPGGSIESLMRSIEVERMSPTHTESVAPTSE